MFCNASLFLAFNILTFIISFCIASSISSKPSASAMALSSNNLDISLEVFSTTCLTWSGINIYSAALTVLAFVFFTAPAVVTVVAKTEPTIPASTICFQFLKTSPASASGKVAASKSMLVTSVAISDPDSLAMFIPRLFTKPSEPPLIKSKAACLLPLFDKKLALFKIPLVATSNPACIAPVPKALIVSWPVFKLGSFSNSSSNLLPAVLRPKATNPPGPSAAIATEGIDSIAAPTALSPANK